MDITTDHMKGKTPSSSTNSSGNNDDNNKKMYRGVRKRKWGKWVCEIRLPNSRERIWLGSYDSPEKAARAFDAALYCLRGRHATFNFPDSPFHLENTATVSNDPQQIREIAANFANKTPPIVIDGSNNSNTNNNNNNTDESKTVTEIIGSSSSTTTMHDNGGNSIDWTFLDVLDGSSNDTSFVGSENYGGFYSDLEKMNSGELFSLPQQLPLFEDNIQKELVKGEGDDDVYDDPFSHQPFLWNWDF